VTLDEKSGNNDTVIRTEEPKGVTEPKQTVETGEQKLKKHDAETVKEGADFLNTGKRARKEYGRGKR